MDLAEAVVSAATRTVAKRRERRKGKESLGTASAEESEEGILEKEER